MQTNRYYGGLALAGLAAAVSAREKGAQVPVLETRKRVGGISVTGMGLFAVESHHQKGLNLDSVFSKDDAFHYIMDRTHWKLDGKVARAYVDKSADTIEWLEDMGVRFELMNKVTFPGRNTPDRPSCKFRKIRNRGQRHSRSD